MKPAMITPGGIKTTPEQALEERRRDAIDELGKVCEAESATILELDPHFGDFFEGRAKPVLRINPENAVMGPAVAEHVRSLRAAQQSLKILEGPLNAPKWSVIDYLETGALPAVPKGVIPNSGVDIMARLGQLSFEERNERVEKLASVFAQTLCHEFGLGVEDPSRWPDGKLLGALGGGLDFSIPVRSSRIVRDRVEFSSCLKFLTDYRDVVTAMVSKNLGEQLVADRENILEYASENPQASVWEIVQDMRMLGCKSKEEDLVSHYLQSGVERPIDRLGRTPLRFIMASLALEQYRACVGTTEDQVYEAWAQRYPSLARELQLDPSTIKELRSTVGLVYRYLPPWRPPPTPGLYIDYKSKDWPIVPFEKASWNLNLEDLHPAAQQELIQTGDFAFESRMAHVLRDRCPEAPSMRNRKHVTVEHAITDKVPYFLDMILNEGIKGEDIFVIAKRGSADPEVVALLREMCGINVMIAKDDADLERQFRNQVIALKNAGERDIDLHVEGINPWPWIAEMYEQQPEIRGVQVSHTTSDLQHLLRIGDGVSHLYATRMGDCEAKQRFEPYMFRPQFRVILENLPEELEGKVPDIYDRQLIIHGGLGKIMGSSMVGAFLDLVHTRPQAHFSDLTIVDPLVDTPQHQARCDQLRALGVRLVKGTQVPDDLMDKKLLAINATANEVWSPRDYERLKTDDIIVMNLGSGQNGFSMDWLVESSSQPEVVGVKHNQPNFAYQTRLPDGSKGPRVIALGNGHPYNLVFRKPNPESLSQFTNLMILESLKQATWNRLHDRPGPARLGSVRVSFSKDHPPTPIIVFIDRDIPPQLPWPEVWPDTVELDAADCEMVGDAKLVFWRSQADPRGREKTLALCKAGGVEIPKDCESVLRQPFPD